MAYITQGKGSIKNRNKIFLHLSHAEACLLSGKITGPVALGHLQLMIETLPLIVVPFLTHMAHAIGPKQLEVRSKVESSDGQGIRIRYSLIDLAAGRSEIVGIRRTGKGPSPCSEPDTTFSPAVEEEPVEVEVAAGEESGLTSQVVTIVLTEEQAQQLARGASLRLQLTEADNEEEEL